MNDFHPDADWHGDEPCHIHRMALVVGACLSGCIVLALVAGALRWER